MTIDRNPIRHHFVSITRDQLANRLQRLAKKGETRTETVERPYGLIVEVTWGGNPSGPVFFTYRIVG